MYSVREARVIQQQRTLLPRIPTFDLSRRLYDMRGSSDRPFQIGFDMSRFRLRYQSATFHHMKLFYYYCFAVLGYLHTNIRLRLSPSLINALSCELFIMFLPLGPQRRSDVDLATTLLIVRMSPGLQSQEGCACCFSYRLISHPDRPKSKTRTAGKRVYQVTPSV